MADTFDFDIFVSHASEDKDAFVRPLVHALETEHLAVWFDEGELLPGASVVQSVEHGLSRSRFAVVVLSPAFFQKNWPRAELNALASRELATGESVLLPIWLDVDVDDVRGYSPLLSDRYAIVANRGMTYTIDKILNVVRPGRSPVVVARERLADWGVATPPPSDTWWLDLVESGGRFELEGTFQEPLEWGRWGFPLPPKSSDPGERGERLAHLALQNAWQKEADARPITQITRPAVVHDFVHEMPGLFEKCCSFPRTLAAYAPQLLLPGFGGEFEVGFDDWVSVPEPRPATMAEEFAIHSLDFDEIKASHIAGHFVQGELMGPQVKYYETVDYIFWVLSDESSWAPGVFRSTLLEGFRQWRVWPWYGGRRPDGYEREDLFEELMTAKEEGLLRPLSQKALADLVARADLAARELVLPEDGQELADRFLSSGLIQAFVEGSPDPAVQ